MDDRSTISNILKGAAGDEDPLDLLHMCLTVTTLKLRRTRSPMLSIMFYDQLELVGQILCPIFTPVKPPDYVASMRQARQAFLGLSTVPAMQSDFADLAIDLVNEGLFDSLRNAIEGRLWARLTPRGTATKGLS